VNVTLTLAMQENAVLVPSRAVQTGRDEKYVFIIRDDNIAETRKVVVRATAGPDTVIEQGLQAGERVVTDGQVRLLTGSKVEIAALGGKAAGGGKGKAAGASK
jgi:multidrug efflux system membrane fusion protein